MILWRLVFSSSKARKHSPMHNGPWHPDRSYVEQMALWFRSIGREVQIQSNKD